MLLYPLKYFIYYQCPQILEPKLLSTKENYVSCYGINQPNISFLSTFPSYVSESFFKSPPMAKMRPLTLKSIIDQKLQEMDPFLQNSEKWYVRKLICRFRFFRSGLDLARDLLSQSKVSLLVYAFVKYSFLSSSFSLCSTASFFIFYGNFL